MARPRKCRRICALPKNVCFGPIAHREDTSQDATECGDTFHSGVLVMALDEYETIRLIDLLGCTQEECAEQMGVARTTVQAVYNSARQKLAGSLVEGKKLLIRGGDYALCPHAAGCCKKRCGGRNHCAGRWGEAKEHGPETGKEHPYPMRGGGCKKTMK